MASTIRSLRKTLALSAAVSKIADLPSFAKSTTSGIAPVTSKGPATYAVIDLGTNSFRMLVGREEKDGGFRILDSHKVTVRLGQGVFSTGLLSDGAMERSLACLRDFKSRIDPFAPHAVRLVATSALREAPNRKDFLRRVERELDWKAEIVSGIEEARLIATAIAPLVPQGKKAFLIDIGGGSTELTYVWNGTIRPLKSFGLGAVRLADLFLHRDPASDRAIRLMREFIGDTLGLLEEKAKKFSPDLVIGSAGTIKSILKLAGGAEPDTEKLVPLETKAVEKVFEKLKPLPLPERIAFGGMSERRAEVIVPGALLLLEMMRRLGAEKIHVTGRGLVDGVLVDLIENREHHTSYVEHLAAQNLAEFGWLASRFQIDERHVRRVHDLALNLFDGLQELHGYGEEEKRLLGCAALFHDVGRIVEPGRHHKHSYYILKNLPLSGFTQREIEIIALVARYHRGNPPEADHEGYSELDKEDRRLVDRLGGILRLAEGLDHSRDGRIESLRVEATAKEIILKPRSSGDADMDLWAAARKVDLLEKAFGRKVSGLE
ncbi:MAG: Ppx/GppA phosphatase family protein [Bdellovibrionota bacterium]